MYRQVCGQSVLCLLNHVNCMQKLTVRRLVTVTSDDVDTVDAVAMHKSYTWAYQTCIYMLCINTLRVYAV